MSGSRVLHEARVVWGKEMRCLLRDRHTVIYSVLLPLFLYPTLIWGTLQLGLYSRALEERTISRIVVEGVETGDPVVRWLDEVEEIEIVEEDEGSTPIAERLHRRDIDAFLRVETSAGDAASPSGGLAPVSATLSYNAAADSSVLAATRVEEALDRYRDDVLLRLAREAGEDDDFLEVVDVREEDLASRRELANYIASLLLPMLMVFMTALGALYPALEATVGEKERGTLETTLSSGSHRISVVLGKYGAVVAFSLLAFFLNFASMWFTFAHLRDQFRLEGFSLGVFAGAAILAGAILFSLLVSALMMVLGFFAKSFREGQSYVTPVYLLAAVPALLAAAPDVAFSSSLALVPVVNVTLVFRDALQGRLEPWTTGLALASSAVFVALAILLASRLLRREEVATGGSISPARIIQAILGRTRGLASPAPDSTSMAQSSEEEG